MQGFKYLSTNLTCKKMIKSLISDHELGRFPVKECGERLVSLNLLRPLGIWRPEKKSVRNVHGHIVRKSVAKKILNIINKMSRGIYFAVEEGYRPKEIQQKMWRRALRKWRNKYPKWGNEEIKEFAAKYTANPSSYLYHVTGGVVDVTLINKNGKELDMGKPFHTRDNRLSKEAKKNRRLLIRLMEEQGFVNYPLEWWHWSYGESLWAMTKKKSHAIYGAIPLKSLRKFYKKG